MTRRAQSSGRLRICRGRQIRVGWRLLQPALLSITVAILVTTPIAPPAAAQTTTRVSPVPGGAPAWFDVARALDDAATRVEQGETIWEYELVVTEEELFLADGTPYKVWAFGGSVPGPLMVAREGDRIRIHLINETSNSHTIHSHGLYVPHRMDGVPHAEAHTRAEEELRVYDRAVAASGVARAETAPAEVPGAGSAEGGHAAHRRAGAPMEMPPWARPVAPGESFVYDFIARPAGTHFYHCHMNTNEHLDRGMSGPLVVLPREPEPAVDIDVAVVLDEWNSEYARRGVPGDPRQRWAYDYFTINGRSFPHTKPLRLELGQIARVRMIHAGAVQHFMHLHGQHFLVTHRDGMALAEPLMLDTVEIGPGQRVDLLILGENPGAWPFHDHITAHVTNAGRYPGGMLTKVQIGPEAMPDALVAPEQGGLRALQAEWRKHAQKKE